MGRRRTQGPRPFDEAFVADLRAVARVDGFGEALVPGAQLGPLLGRHGIDLAAGMDERSFLGDFYNESLYQDTCRPGTAGGLFMLAHLAVDHRVPPGIGSKPSICWSGLPPLPSATSPRPGRPPRARRRSRQRGTGPQRCSGPHSRSAGPLVGRMPRCSTGPRRARRRLPDGPHPARPWPKTSAVLVSGLYRRWRENCGKPIRRSASRVPSRWPGSTSLGRRRHRCRR